MYNNTPHSSTGKTPFELFFGRLARDKLPSLKDLNEPQQEEAADRDRLQKEKGKQYADNKRHATTSDLEPGDKVLVKNMVKENKLTSNFDPAMHTVISKTEGDVAVQNDATGKKLRRNVVHLKKVGGNWKITNPDNQITSDDEIEEAGGELLE